MFSEKDIAALTMINGYVERTFTLLEKISLGEMELRKEMVKGCDPQFAQVRMAEIAASKEMAMAYFALIQNIADKVFQAFMEHEKMREARLADKPASASAFETLVAREVSGLRERITELEYRVDTADERVA